MRRRVRGERRGGAAEEQEYRRDKSASHPLEARPYHLLPGSGARVIRCRKCAGNEEIADFIASRAGMQRGEPRMQRRVASFSAWRASYAALKSLVLRVESLVRSVESQVRRLVVPGMQPRKPGMQPRAPGRQLRAPRIRPSRILGAGKWIRRASCRRRSRARRRHRLPARPWPARPWRPRAFASARRSTVWRWEEAAGSRDRARGRGSRPS